MNSKKNKYKDEIDLVEVTRYIWDNKWKIVLILLITVIFSIIIKLNTKISESTFRAKTEILPISTFEDTEYSAYNTLLTKKQLNLNYISNNLDDVILKNQVFKPDSTYLDKINKEFLFNLFMEKLNQKNLFIQGVEKFNMVMQEKYKNTKDYKSAVLKLASKIKLDYEQDQGVYYIEFTANKKEDWENFLVFIQDTANLEIQNYLKNNFELFVSNSEMMKKYTIEDIEFEIANNLDNEVIKSSLLKMKKRTQKNLYITRLENEFSNTPIYKSDNFKAAKFNIKLTDYKERKKQNYSMKKTIATSAILGGLLGIFYVLIITTIQKRRS